MRLLMKNVPAYISVLAGLVVVILLLPTVLQGLTSHMASASTLRYWYYLVALMFLLGTSLWLAKDPENKSAAILEAAGLVAVVGPGIMTTMAMLDRVNASEIWVSVLASLLVAALAAAVGLGAITKLTVMKK